MDNTILFLGGPDSGKTNYVARIWLATKAKSGLLTRDSIPEDIKYVNDAASALLRGKFAPRTAFGVQETIRLPIVLGDRRLVLSVPDASGEEWKKAYRNRAWSDVWEEAAPAAKGYLLFVRAASKLAIAPLDWLACSQIWAGKMPKNMTAPELNERPYQVLAVEWLQFLRSVAESGDRLRVGIVVSAWDRVPEDTKPQGPAAYVSATFPLLAQFLATNGASFDTEFFGVSIVGGDLAEPEVSEAFIKDPDACGYVCSSRFEGTRKDVTIPLAWALGEKV